MPEITYIFELHEPIPFFFFILKHEFLSLATKTTD